jgi:hypothetical protein
MIAITINEKCSWTTGMFPKKNPNAENRVTQRKPPIEL